MDKIELKEKIDQNYKSQFFFLKDDIIEEDFSSLIKETQRILELDRLDIPIGETKLVFYVLVRLTRTWEGGEDGWLAYLSKKIFYGEKNRLNGTIYNKITRCIDSLIEREQIQLFSSFRKKYYATVCAYALAPRKSIEALFSLALELYTTELEQDYDGNEQDVQLFSDYLVHRFKNMKSEEEQLTLGSKSYSLRIGIKALALDAHILFQSLLKRVVSSIDFRTGFLNAVSL